MRKLSRNDRVLVMCSSVVVGMLGLTYASAPLYRIFCQATGFDGTPRFGAISTSGGGGGEIEVRFDANVGQGLPWDFKPDRLSMHVRLGENNDTFYRARNNSDAPIRGHAKFNVTPLKAAQYFSKLECFCLKDPKLNPWEAAKLGVSFVIDPAIATDPATKDVRTVTLSYTFFPAKTETQTASVASTR